MTRDEVKGIFKYLIVTYENFEISLEKVDIWYELLEDIDYQEALKAVKEHIKVNKFSPTIAEIREAVKENKPMYDDYKNTETYREFIQLQDGEEQ